MLTGNQTMGLLSIIIQLFLPVSTINIRGLGRKILLVWQGYVAFAVL
jgi:hypothetical protein